MGLEIVFASTAEGTQGTLVAFQACVDDHVSLPVALAFDDQSTHRTLEWFPTILRRALRGTRYCFYSTQNIQGVSEAKYYYLGNKNHAYPNADRRIYRSATDSVFTPNCENYQGKC